MEQDFNIEHWQDKKCPPVNCRKKTCECGLEKVFLSSALGDDSKDSPIAPKNGAYCNAIVVYEANSHVYIYSKEGVPTLVETDGDVEETIEQLEDQLAQEILDRQAADNVLQGEIDDLKNSPDVVDIVPTYAALQAYDTSKLGDNDIIRVLQDETHDNNSTYYRWDSQTETWTYVGSIPAINVVQTPGNSQTDVMSQDAATSMVFANPTARTEVRIGNTGTVGNNSMSIGHNADASSTFCLAVGVNARAQSPNSTAIGAGSSTESNWYSVALGYKARTTRNGEVNVGVYNTNAGYNHTPYRVIGGVYDGQDAHDVATVGQLDGRVLQNAGAPTTSTVGAVGQLLEDTTNGKLYQCTAVTPGTDPDPDTYTWTEVGSGGGSNVVQTPGNSQTDVMSQDATTKMIYPDIVSSPGKILIGSGSLTNSGSAVAIHGNVVNNLASGSIAIGGGSSSPANVGTGGRAVSGVAIGSDAYIGAGDSSVAIGYNSYCYSTGTYPFNVALGTNSYIYNVDFSVALGACAKPTRSGEVNIGTGSWTAHGYNSSNYRVLGGVYDGQLAHDAATVGQLDGRVLQNAGAPTTATVGTVGQLLEDTTNGKLYQCTAVDTTDPDNPSYTWVEVGGGGGGVTVVQTTGTSTTDVMSQDATTKLIYPDIANRPYKQVIGEGYIDGTNKGLAINGILNQGINGGSIAIGAPDGNIAQIGQSGRASQSIAIGVTAAAGRGMQSIAIGSNAYTNSGQDNGDNVALGANTYAGNGSATSTVALGAYAKTTRTGEVNIGTGGQNQGYNSTDYRVIGGVHDGQLANDAVTVGQVNSVIDAINTALSTNIPHIGA